MKSSVPASVRTSVIANYLGRGWSALMGLAFIPLYTRMMGVEAMGVIGLFVTLQAICLLLDAGLSTTLNREFARMSLDAEGEHDMRNLLRTFEVPYWLASLCGGVAVYCLAPVLSYHWVHAETLPPQTIQYAIRLMGFVIFFQLPLSLYGGGMLGLQKQVEYSLLNAVWYTLRFAGVIVALHLFGQNLAVFFQWQVFVAAIATGTSSIVLLKSLPAKTSRTHFALHLLTKRWQFAAGLGAISFTLLILNNIDKVILSRAVTLRSFGFYTLAWTLANTVRLFADPLYTTFFPRLSQAWASGDVPRLSNLYHTVCRLMALAIIPFGLTVVFFAPEAILCWTKQPLVVENTTALVRLLALGNVFLALTIVPYALQLASGWTSLTFWANLLSAFVLVPAMALLANSYGTLGGGIAWVVLNGLYLFATVRVMHKRLLVGEFMTWLTSDVIQPTIVVLAVLVPLRLLLPYGSSQLVSVFNLITAFAISQSAGLTLSPLRNQLVVLYNRAKGNLRKNKLVEGNFTFEGKTACFFVKTSDPSILDRNEFYRIDIDILSDLGLQTTVVTDIFHLPKADIYVVWWWTWAFVPLIRAKLLGKPLIIVGAFDHVMPDGSFQVYPTRPSHQRALIKWALSASTANVVCAEDQRELMSRKFRSSPIEVSPHVLNTEVYKPAAASREPFFVTVCWMNADNAIRKCVATSIKAMVAARDRLPDFRLLVVGQKGDGYPALANLVKDLGAEHLIEFTGVVTQEEKVDLMQRCTAYLQPTLAEGFGVAILEGMSCGAPVIVSPAGAVPSVVGDCALFVDGLDYEGLANAMCRIAGEPHLSLSLSQRGRDRAVREFSYSRRLMDFRRILANAMR